MHDRKPVIELLPELALPAVLHAPELVSKAVFAKERNALLAGRDLAAVT